MYDCGCKYCQCHTFKLKLNKVNYIVTGTRYGRGMGNIFMLIPASVISLVLWIVYTVFK